MKLSHNWPSGDPHSKEKSRDTFLQFPYTNTPNPYLISHSKVNILSVYRHSSYPIFLIMYVIAADAFSIQENSIRSWSDTQDMDCVIYQRIHPPVVVVNNLCGQVILKIQKKEF